MEFSNLVSAIPDRCRQLIKNQSIPLNENEICVHLNGARKTINEVKCRNFCISLLSRITKLPTATHKWTKSYSIREDEWKNIFGLPIESYVKLTFRQVSAR